MDYELNGILPLPQWQIKQHEVSVFEILLLGVGCRILSGPKTSIMGLAIWL